MRQRKVLFISLVCLLGLALTASSAFSAVKVRVQPSGSEISSAYVLVNETRTYFGNVEGGTGTYKYKWEFSNGGNTGWSGVADPRYISIDHTFGGSGAQYARLTVEDTTTLEQSSATIQVMVLSADSLNRQKNSAVDRGLRKLYLDEVPTVAGSYWNQGGYPLASTSMALIALENHRHNLEASDDDIYKKSMQEGLRWLLNQAYPVPLSTQACIGDPEGDDGDQDHDGIGVGFNNTWSEGYEWPLVLLALVNSCSKETAQTLTAVTTDPNNFVNGMTLWDIAVDIKDFLAYAQTDNAAAGGGFSNYCSNSNNGYGEYDVWQEGQTATFNFYAYKVFPGSSGGSDTYWDDTKYFYYESDGSGYVYFEDGLNLPAVGGDCANLLFKVDYGDGNSELLGPEYCDPAGYAYKSFGHTYAAGTWTATGSYSLDAGATWIDIASFSITIGSQVQCDQVQFKFDYDATNSEVVGPSYCESSYAYIYYVPHSYAAPGTYPSKASFSTDGGQSWNEICGFDVVYQGGAGACSPYGEGWRYSANYGSIDNSNSQWPVLGLQEAKERWDIFINPRAIDAFKTWLAYSQGADGGFPYDSPGYWENFAKTGAGLAMLKWVGFGASDSQVQSALNYLGNHYCDTDQGGNFGYDYGMYAFYKGMKYLGLDTLVGVDCNTGNQVTHNWETEYSQFLISNQQTDGSWVYPYIWLQFPGPDFSTASALAMLAPAVAGLPPVADAGGPYGPVNANQTVTLDGSGSYHQDPARHLVLYQWDFDSSNGLWWDTQAIPGSEGAEGSTASVSYPDAGQDATYTVTLRVKDDSATPQFAVSTSTVTVTSGNVAPVARTNGPWAGLPGVPVLFDGSASYDPNSCTTVGDPSCLGDAIVKYEWDLDGDGLFNEANGEDGTPVVAGDYSKVTKTFPVPTNGLATLRVTDQYGLQNSSSAALGIVSIAIVYGQDYSYCWSKQLTRYEYLLGLQVLFKNVGDGTAQNVRVTLTSTPTNLTRVGPDESTAFLGNMAPEGTALTACNPSNQTADLVLKMDRRIRPTGEWLWTAEFDFGGEHYVIANLPPLAP